MQTVRISVVREGNPDPAVQCPADIAPALIERIGHLDRAYSTGRGTNRPTRSSHLIGKPKPELTST